MLVSSVFTRRYCLFFRVRRRARNIYVGRRVSVRVTDARGKTFVVVVRAANVPPIVPVWCGRFAADVASSARHGETRAAATARGVTSNTFGVRITIT